MLPLVLFYKLFCDRFTLLDDIIQASFGSFMGSSSDKAIARMPTIKAKPPPIAFDGVIGTIIRHI